MLELIQAIPFSFGALFPVLNPVGSSLIVLSLVNGASNQDLNKLAIKIALYTSIMLIIVLFVGSDILRAFGISIPIVLIGGGLILAYIGWQLLNQPTSSNKPNITASTSSEQLNSMSFYPLTMPVTAGPGCIAVVIALGAHNNSTSWHKTLLGHVGSSIGIMLVALTIYLCYRYAHVIAAKCGTTGTEVIIRLAAFINLCIGLQLMWRGTQLLLNVA